MEILAASEIHLAAFERGVACSRGEKAFRCCSGQARSVRRRDYNKHTFMYDGEGVF